MSIQCHAAIATGDGTFIIDQIEVQDPQADEVLVKVKASGICHTDYDSLNWGKPVVMGHEGAGIVAKLGSAVSSVAEGDRVILNWATPCGECFQCQKQNEHLCEQNSPVVAGGNGYTPGHAHREGTRWQNQPIDRSFNLGTMAEYALVKESAIVKNPSESMSFPAASIIGCGVMTGVGSVLNSARVPSGASVVVLGSGGVGLNVIQGAKLSGANPIIAIDINEHRLKMAKQFGATHTIQANKGDQGLLQAAQKVKEMTQGRGADYAFECTAIPELGAAPLAMVRNAGTAVQVSGIEQDITIDMRLFEWDKLYLNPLYGGCQPLTDFPKLVDFYDKGELMLEELITRTYPLDQLALAFDDMLGGKNAKGVLVFD